MQKLNSSAVIIHPHMFAVDSSRLATIADSCGIPNVLASIVEQYDAHYAMLRELIKHLYRYNNSIRLGNQLNDLLEITLDHHCALFPFCNPEIAYCRDCRISSAYTNSSAVSVHFGCVSYEDTFCMLNNDMLEPNGIVPNAHIIILKGALIKIHREKLRESIYAANDHPFGRDG